MASSGTVHPIVWVLAALMLILIVGSPFVTSAEGPPASATRIAAPFLAGLGFFPIAFALSGWRGLGLGLAMAAATCGGMVAAVEVSHVRADLATTIAWVPITFGCLGGIVSPLLVLGWRATAAAIWLIVAALGCGSIVLARGDLSDPEPLLVFNPLVRIMRHGLDFDWLHATNMYPRVGTHYYSYPDRTAGILTAVLICVVGLAVSGMIALTRRRPVPDR